METSQAPICDECPRKAECTFMCQDRIEQFEKEEELADIHASLSVAHNVTTGEEYLSILQTFPLKGVGDVSLVTQVELVEASASPSSPNSINRDNYLRIKRSHYAPRPRMPLRGWAETISGKFSPPKPKPALEVISTERQEFPQKTIYPKGFPVSIVCAEFCDKLSKCKILHTEFDDLCKYDHKLGILVREAHLIDRKTVKPEVWVKNPSPSRMRDNSKYLGFFDPVEVAECLAEGTRLQPWEYRAYMEDPDTPRRIYVGDDNLMRESELGKHTREEDSTFAAYSSQEFLDANDDPEDGRELEYTMDTGMVSPEKSQSGFIPSYIYRTVYRDRKVLMGFESRRVERPTLKKNASGCSARQQVSS